MLKAARIAVLLCALLSPGRANALSCGPPPFSATAIEAAPVIFEGTVLSVSDAELPLARRISNAWDPIVKHGGSLDTLKSYTFKVTKEWKGVGGRATFAVLRNVNWGDEFLADTPYLVVVTEESPGIFMADICGHTTDTKSEYGRNKIDVLEKYFSVE